MSHTAVVAAVTGHMPCRDRRRAIVDALSRGTRRAVRSYRPDPTGIDRMGTIDEPHDRLALAVIVQAYRDAITPTAAPPAGAAKKKRQQQDRSEHNAASLRHDDALVFLTQPHRGLDAWPYACATTPT